MYILASAGTAIAGIRTHETTADSGQLAAPSVSVGGRQSAVGRDADALYAQRENLDAARRAAALWDAALKENPDDFAAAWKLARARYWLGGRAAGEQVKTEHEAGAAAARRAIAVRPGRPEGHFWLAANLGALAETGRLTGLRLRSEIRRELERVLAIDPAFQHGSADRALGRWYLKVPRLFGGSRSKSEMHLRRSLEYNPHSTASLFFLAETLLADDRPDEAKTLLQQVLEAPIDPEWAPEDREFKRRARELLDSARSLVPAADCRAPSVHPEAARRCPSASIRLDSFVPESSLMNPGTLRSKRDGRDARMSIYINIFNINVLPDKSVSAVRPAHDGHSRHIMCSLSRDEQSTHLGTSCAKGEARDAR